MKTTLCSLLILALPFVPHGAAVVERLLAPFWEGGRHDSIPSILKQKSFVEEQLRRFPSLDDYPHTLSDRLRTLRDELTARMREDASGWREVLTVPESLAGAVGAFERSE